MDAKDMNLNEIHKLSESEFRKHFAQWVEEDGVARALQAKLRKDLIETFSKTHLGRRIYLMYSRANRMILSPLILALNTLVAEFLFAQNCHFSLSVFSTEVPFRNTLPDFDSETPFRFTKGDIKEIFEAISIDVTEEFQDVVVDCYLNKTTPKGCLSLLYVIFKYLFSSQRKEKMNAQSTAKSSEPETARSEYSKDKSDSESTQPKDQKSSERNPKQQQLNSLYDNQFRYLNRYLIILSRKVKEMSNSLEQLEKRDTDCNRLQRKSLQTRRIEHLNRSLDKISENLRALSVSKRKNRKMAIIVSSIDKLAQQLEQCSENFQTMSHSMRNPQLLNSEKTSSSTEKSYSDWVKELTSTKSGKKFVAKIEIALRQTLEEEKEKLAQAFEKKLENHKSLIKLKYKQKLLQRLEVHPSKNSQDDKDKGVAIQNYIERKLDEISKKHDDLIKKIQGREDISKQEDLKNEAILSTEDERLNEDKVVSVRRKLFDEMSQDENIVIREKRNGKIQKKTKDVQTDPPEKKSVDLKFQLEEMARSIAEQEHNIDEIIYGAKLRVQELEYESNQLDRSFQVYIEKQREKKSQEDANTAHIWNSYTLQKSLLEHPNIKRRTSIKKTKLIDIGNIVVDRLSNTNTSTPAVSSVDENPRQIPSPVFVNPFRELKKDVFEKEPWVIGNPLFEDIPTEHSKKLEQIDPCSEFESPLDMQHNIEESKETYNRYLEANAGSEVHLTPVSSEIHLPDTTLEGIVLSDTKSSEKSKSLSSKSVSMALKIPNMTLSRNEVAAPESSLEMSESSSNRLDISMGKQESSASNFWD